MFCQDRPWPLMEKRRLSYQNLLIQYQSTNVQSCNPDATPLRGIQPPAPLKLCRSWPSSFNSSNYRFFNKILQILQDNLFVGPICRCNSPECGCLSMLFHHLCCHALLLHRRVRLLRTDHSGVYYSIDERGCQLSLVVSIPSPSEF